MSAIAGIFRLDGRGADRGDLERMVERMAHRGPDGSSAWHAGPIALGHAMLHTTPESLHERQPVTSRDGVLTIVADARIDNRDELHDALAIDPRERRRMSDSELILTAYEAFGEGCVERLIGDFAFAVWDAARQVLVCARDPFGVRPLYYCHVPGRVFALASEVKALLCLDVVPRALNESAVHDYLAGTYRDRTGTFYRGVRRLAPARCLGVDATGVRERAYWSLDDSRELVLGSDAEYAEAIREAFETAVRCRMRSSGPAGSLLSGGLDSSAVACVAARSCDGSDEHRLHTFSAVFDAFPDSDERTYIDAVLASGRFADHRVIADPVSPLGDVERLLRFQDEPFVAPTATWEWALYECAGDHGVRTLLHGSGGDSVQSHGEMQITELARAGRWIAAARGLAALRRDYDVSCSGAFVQYVAAPLFPVLTRSFGKLLGRRGPAHPSLIDPGFAARVARQGPDEPGVDWTDSRVTMQRWHARALGHAALPLLLEGRDRSAAPHGIDPRYPFYDRRLVELCVSLPGSQRLSGGWSRIAMRRAMDGILPAAVRWRDHKSENLAYFVDRLVTLDGERLTDLAANGPSVLDRFVERGAIRDSLHRLVAAHRAGDATGAGDDARALWRVAVLDAWLRSAEPGR